ncbi:integrase [Synechococcus sp. Cruz-9H2]|uniref:integrase n=1 Tax=unclassified Synechococcus TaxID=2626047 RepID=UPI0028F45BFD|nr:MULTISPECIES: integrase [unclassified Synechococcus]MCP9819820.1 integrase [Synechococcus sp. Cruz-9H2]MCP9844114.1 integrase [Synechococcus sp. Edmonson 11F2]MCP9856250.1 integrase [Synechococcus sp. Cruz-9C9]MCP9863535.1 integrase [Synechococcus sp. Cruz-7E5]MCP9870731.1 integrase [Synechococcus sp. Cruz-7B9]
MAPRDPYLARINRALKDLGHAVAMEVAPSGKRLRLRATLPRPDGSWGQQRVCTPFPYPAGLEQARELAEELGRDVELHRRGLQPFPLARWLGDGTKTAGRSEQAISGLEAVSRTEEWWFGARRRSATAPTTWLVDYARPLAPLLALEEVGAEQLLALVRCCMEGSRSRRRAAQAAATVALAIELGPTVVEQLRQAGKGYSPQRDAAPRELPSDEQIVELIDRLPSGWQWVAAICATYGARPHEALLMAEVQANGLVLIRGGKTGARQGLPLPKVWIERWSLLDRRLPAINLERDHRTVGSQLGVALRRYEAPFVAYDLRHAWAVRAIHQPQISPSLAAKSLGHSLMVHTTLYQRWFDSASMASLVAQM